jgi:hypothetical protein
VRRRREGEKEKRRKGDENRERERDSREKWSTLIAAIHSSLSASDEAENKKFFFGRDI